MFSEHVMMETRVNQDLPKLYVDTPAWQPSVPRNYSQRLETMQNRGACPVELCPVHQILHVPSFTAEIMDETNAYLVREKTYSARELGALSPALWDIIKEQKRRMFSGNTKCPLW